KPIHTDKSTVDRVGFVLSHLHRRGGVGVLVDDMFDWVHVDEKSFYLVEGWKKITCLQAPEASNKRFILKTVFLAAVARPGKLSSGVWFEGKVGIWPIVEVVTAQRASKSSARGDSVLRPVTVDGEKYRKIMNDEVIPAINATMPGSPGHTIFQELDGAKTHTKKGVMEALQTESGNSIILETHPSNSPDLNMNYLSFFHSIQQLKEHVGETTAEGLVKATLEAFDIYPRDTLECVWDSLFAVFGEILGSKGNNSYQIPHSGKEQDQRKRGLP
ncbi:unnamed protein product, partial [Discosporangium mesarthrocarpum]